MPLPSVSLKNLALRLLLVLVTATDNISTNVILEYLMMNSVFESLMQVGGSEEWRGYRVGMGRDGVEEWRGGIVREEGGQRVLIRILLLYSCQILSVPEMRDHHGYDGVVVVTMLINYRKYEVSVIHVYACNGRVV